MSHSPSYTTVPGFFIHDDSSVNPNAIEVLPARFGLLDDSLEHWSNFKSKVTQLEASAPTGTIYKVLFLGRHGQGYHNAGVDKYGREAWKQHWSLINGDSETSWGPDAVLTPLGHAQANEARRAWKSELNNGLPLPEKLYCSPLRRALETWADTFGRDDEEAILSASRRKVLILENLREEYGLHTCDLRSSLTYLQSIYSPPIYEFESSFAECDPLWLKDEREPKSHVAERAASILNKIFQGPETYISITAHGAFFNCLLGVVGHAPYKLPNCAVMPIVVKQTLSEPSPTHTAGIYPLTSVYRN